MNEALAELAVRRRAADEVEREAMASGMRTLWDDGMAKVQAGLTSIEELARVTV
jgi:type II secretory ATPase GspE/PulE/Tfp pilus assembly ATPase PilB-like protein